MLLRLYKNAESTIDLDIAIHIQKPIESILYKSYVEDISGVPIAYIESEDINAKKNLEVINKSITLEENSPKSNFSFKNWYKFKGSSFNTSYNNILITDKAVFDSSKSEKPLWYCMKFSKNLVNIKFEEFTRQGRKPLQSNYSISDSLRKVYFDFDNYYNPVSKEFKLYFYTAYFDDSTISRGLINPISAVYEATWEDLDSDGNLVEGQAYWTQEQIGNYYTYTLSESNTYYIKVEDSSFISPLEFNQNLPEDGWFMNFSIGHFTHVDDSSVLREYKVPEYDTISFYPAEPYVYDSYSPVSLITKKICYCGRRNIAINNSNRPLEIIISDKSGTPIKALTTKSTKNGTKYNSTINWDAESIISYDNKNGLFELAFDLQDNHDIRTSLYYEAKSLVYTDVNLNPIYNDLVYDHFYVFYVIPDQTERAIHHLLVKNDGTIIDTSETSKKLNIGNAYNPNTYVGLTYKYSQGTTSPNDWYSLYSSDNDNDYKYLILAETYFKETLPPAALESYSITRPAFELSEDALYHNPRLQQSEIVSSYQGLQYPRNLTYIVNLSYSLLEEYGGEFTLEEVKEELYRFVAAGKLLVFEWDEDINTIEFDNDTANQITLNWPDLGPDFTYNIYRSESLTDNYTFIANSNVFAYTDTGLTSGTVYYYYIKPYKDSVEYPSSITIGIEVR